MSGDDKTNIKEEKKEKKPEQKVEYTFAVRPEKREGWDAFSHFVWNPETKEFLGRTGMSWCKYYNNCHEECIYIYLHLIRMTYHGNSRTFT